MDTFWAIVLIGGVIFYFLNKAGNAKAAEQQRQARLATVIHEFGYEFQDAHIALGDVRAMAKVLPEMLELGKGITFPSQLKKSPSFDATGKVLPRKSNA